MRIAVVVPDLGVGGAQRVVSLLCSQWARQGHDVTLATFELPGAEPFFDLEPRIRLRQIGAVNRTRQVSEIIRTNVKRVRRLRYLFVELDPDVIVSFMTEANVITLCASRGLNIPTIASERNQPDRPGLGRVQRIASRLCYPWSSALVVQVEELAVWARRAFKVRVYVLPNPLPVERWSDEGASLRGARSAHEIVAAGRLVAQKGFDILIESFKTISPHYPDWTLTIYGEGPERPKLERAVANHGLQDRVTLPGLLKDLRPVFLRASLFVLPSRFEGYPNVLLEALACGCPVIATDCPGGCGEILAQGRYGVLVPNENTECLASALKEMVESPEARASYSARAEGALEALDLPTIANKWINIFAETKRHKWRDAAARLV